MLRELMQLGFVVQLELAKQALRARSRRLKKLPSLTRNRPERCARVGLQLLSAELLAARVVVRLPAAEGPLQPQLLVKLFGPQEAEILRQEKIQGLEQNHRACQLLRERSRVAFRQELPPQSMAESRVQFEVPVFRGCSIRLGPIASPKFLRLLLVALLPNEP